MVWKKECSIGEIARLHGIIFFDRSPVSIFHEICRDRHMAFLPPADAATGYLSASLANGYFLLIERVEMGCSLFDYRNNFSAKKPTKITY